MTGDNDRFPNPYLAATMLSPGRRQLDTTRQFLEDERHRLHERLTEMEDDDGSIPNEATDEWSMVKGKLDQTRLFHGLVIQSIRADELEQEGDDAEFQQEPRDTYVHADGCGATTTMTGDLPESIARDPEYYSKTFCAGCGEHVPVEEVKWEDGADWVVDQSVDANNGQSERGQR